MSLEDADYIQRWAVWHSSYAITADVSSHDGAGQQREAAEQLEAAFAW
jgi:hypothetical protein